MGKLVFFLYFFLNSFIFAEVTKTPKDLHQVNLELTHYLNDPQKRIDNNFKVPDILYKQVKFWFGIYTKYESNQIIIHDKYDMDIIYEVIDFSELINSNLNRNTKFGLKRKILKSKIKEYKDTFKKLSKGGVKSIFAQRIFNGLKEANYKIPKPSAKSRTSFFTKRLKGLRTQTGQKNFIQKGINNFQIYEKTILSYINVFNIPKEVLAIPFLESSFNLKAQSKVGATGPWQFMKRTGKYFMSINSYVDDRRNPLISTISALHLLKQNLKILKRWDLAVTAYNGGTGMILKGVRLLKKKHKFTNPSLPDLVKYYKNNSFGFANKNFYTSFLALVYTLSYKEHFFKNLKELKDEKDFHIYLLKCKLKPNWYLSLLKKSSPDIYNHNTHYRKKKLNYSFPKGTTLISDIDLNTKRYFKVPVKYMRKKYPKNWIKLIKNQSCSTK